MGQLLGSRTAQRCILAVDIKDFSGRRWNDPTRFRQIKAFRALWREARRAAGVRRWRVRQVSTGDGMIGLFNVPDRSVVLDVVAWLSKLLHDHNQDLPAEHRIRLRAAVESGEVRLDLQIESGTAVIAAARMLDRAELRDRLDGSGDDLALMVSEHIHDLVVVPGNAVSFRAADFDEVLLPADAKAGTPRRVRLLRAGCLPPSRLPRAVLPPLSRLEAGVARLFAPVAAARHAVVSAARKWAENNQRVVLLVGRVVLVALVVSTPRTAPLVDCPVPTQLVVLASPDIGETVEVLAERFVDDHDGPCRIANIRVFTTPTYWDAAENVGAGWPPDSPALRDLGPEPDVWIAGATAVTERPDDQLGGQLHVLGPVASSPVVLAAEPAFAEQLSPDATFATWEEIRTWLPRPGQVGAEVGRAAPTSTAAALLTTVALFGLAAEEGSQADLEQRISPVTGDEQDELCRMGAPDGGSRPPRALFTTEQLMAARNFPEGDGVCPVAGEGLRAIYPRDDAGSTPVLDYPYALLPGAFEYEERERLARDFFDYLGQARAALRAAHFRTPDGRDGPGVSLGADPTQPDRELDQPALATVDRTVAAWRRARPTARVLLAMDVSDSMGDPYQGEEGTRLDAVASDAAEQFVARLSDRDYLGLWRFSDNYPGGLPYEEVVPLGTDRADGPSHRGRIAAALRDLRAEPRATRLYETIRAGTELLRASGPPEDARALVVVTDGARGELGTDVGEVLAALDDRARPVRLFLLVLGAAACDAAELAPLDVHPDVLCLQADAVGLPSAFAQFSSVMFGAEEAG